MALTKKLFSEIITFTRPSGGGRWNAQGQYEWLPANTPRIDYDPVTGECLGLLIEEQRTNLLTYSNEFGTSKDWVWTGITQTANAGISPDGKNNAWKLTVNRSGGNYFYKQVPLTASTTYTGSVYIKNVDCSGIKIFMFEEGTGVSKSLDVTSQVSTGTWTRVQIQFTTSASGGTNIRFYVSGNSTGANTSYLVFGAQLEEGSFPTSYIPTTNAQVTRAADIASVNELSPWYRQDEGTLFVEASAAGVPPAAGTSVSFTDGTVANRIIIGQFFTVTRIGSIGVANVDQATLQVSALTLNSPHKFAMSWAANNVAGAVNGGNLRTDSSAAIPSVTRMNIGGLNTAQRFCGHIRSIRYYPRRLSDSELQALTA